MSAWNTLPEETTSVFQTRRSTISDDFLLILIWSSYPTPH